MCEIEKVPDIRFYPGRVLSTRGALEAFREAGEDAYPYLRRHLSGDWGDLCDGDKALNEQAIGDEMRIMSCYHLGNGTKLWLITEADRSVTTFLLPEEY